MNQSINQSINQASKQASIEWPADEAIIQNNYPKSTAGWQIYRK
ncbi:hypothetical protein ACLSU7_03850 [Bdellovibrio sp. HCB185ZH]